MPYPEIPAEIRRELDRRREEAATAFYLHKWEEAEAGFRIAYEFLLEQQRAWGRRFHKGWELHNGGIALLNIPRFDEAVERIALAYVEDALSADQGATATIDDGLAGKVLRGLGVLPGVLDFVKELADEQKKAGDISFDPHDVLTEASKRYLARTPTAGPGLPGATEPPKTGKRAIDDILHPYQKRCFVGGAYFIGGPNLTAIERMVGEQGFDAIIVDKFDIEPDRTHHWSMLLLHLCRKAIFEVTANGGQLMELERCRDYGIEPLLVRHIRPDGSTDQMVSEMVRTMTGKVFANRVIGYDETEELKPFIQAYLTDSPPPE